MISSKEKKETHSHHAKKWFLTIGSIVVFILAGVSFILLPAFSKQADDSQKLPPFGTYNGKPILYEPGTYFTKMIQYYDQTAKDNGQQVDQSVFFQIINSAFGSTVIHMAFTDEVQKSGYVLPETLIDRTMLPYFYGSDGKYSPKLFADTPNSQKIELRKSVAESLLQQRYYSDVFGDSQSYSLNKSGASYGLKQSKAELDFLAQMSNWTRSFEIAAFPTNDFPKEQIIEYGKENAALFVKYDLSVITTAKQDDAKKLLKRIKGNEITFADAVGANSTHAYSSSDGKLVDGYYYYLKRIIKNQAELDSLATLTPGDMSAIIQTENGFSIFKADWSPLEPDFNQDSTQTAVYNYMTSNDAGKIEDYFIAKGKDFAAAAARIGFDAACRAAGVTKITTTPFNLNYNSNPLLKPVPSQEFPILAGAATNESFLKALFSLKQGELSSPILVGKDILVARLVLDSHENKDFESLSFLYPYYVSQFDQQTVQTYFFDSKRLKNDVISVFFKYFINN